MRKKTVEKEVTHVQKKNYTTTSRILAFVVSTFIYKDST